MNESKKTPPVLELSITTDASADEVWQAISDPIRLASWFPLKSSGDQHQGGKVLLSWGEDCEWETHITQWQPGQHLQWMDVLPDAENPDQVLPVVDFHIETQAGKTVLRLVQSGFDPDSNWENYYDGTRRGWLYFLDLLSLYLEHHFDRKRQMVWRHEKFGLDRDVLWQRIVNALGLTVEGVADAQREAVQPEVALPEQPNYVAELRIHEAPYVLGLRLTELAESNLFVELEPGDGAPTCGIWLSTYALTADQRQSLEQSLDQVCKAIRQG